MIKVYHGTDIKNLVNIMKNGLRLEKAITPLSADDLIRITKKIQKELGIDEINRFKVIYAFPEAPSEKEKIEKNTIILEVKVDENEILLLDYMSITKAIFAQIDYNRTKEKLYLGRLNQFLYDYWSSIITYDEYLKDKDKYKDYEVLIFNNVPPENISIYKTNNK